MGAFDVLSDDDERVLNHEDKHREPEDMCAYHHNRSKREAFRFLINRITMEAEKHIGGLNNAETHNCLDYIMKSVLSTWVERGRRTNIGEIASKMKLKAISDPKNPNKIRLVADNEFTNDLVNEFVKETE